MTSFSRSEAATQVNTRTSAHRAMQATGRAAHSLLPFTHALQIFCEDVLTAWAAYQDRLAKAEGAFCMTDVSAEYQAAADGPNSRALNESSGERGT
jgi:hypothetical protein